MNNSTFVYGSELQGRGYATNTDLIVGYMTIICVMNFIIALNRFVAVWLPLHYQRIFNKKLCIFVAVMVACQGLSVITLYLSRP
ncbi:hypothetical protein QR680_016329 [Steinernema hermaphroditum]|uniref:7TM GPCR serpentine receptor class x (Srx) domain-containing protein n=1 Tax=Steinernema hermaphroditum TaxID=289476 RepID=A0AA39HC04_9BILA|nr:hypothetical protein QR680_016329 [Steinernema hermaphroditum]